MSIEQKVVIIGAGPAGLTTAYSLQDSEFRSVILEKDNIVGGISRTANYKGYYFDVGGHRFFTKVKAVEEIWNQLLPEADFPLRKRLSRIYFNKKFFNYPLNISNALFGLGILDSCQIFLSYLLAKLFPQLPERTFEQWVSNRFGKRLYSIFFKTYTEKVWGIPCTEISAEWAGQRIKGLSLISAVKEALLKTGTKDKSELVKTLIHSFKYPRLGPGMMWEAAAKKITERGDLLLQKTAVTKIYCGASKIEAVEIESEYSNLVSQRQIIHGEYFVSSMPLRDLVQALEPRAPQEILLASQQLKYRDFITVVIIINQQSMFPDNWIYIHDPSVQLGRIQNFKNWSPDMVPDPEKTCLGLEYFCFEGDGLWQMTDQELLSLGARELAKIGLVNINDIEDGTVLRMPKAYPVYDTDYHDRLKIVRDYLDQFSNLQVIGRNGMHKYNNQDHSMLTGMLAAKNILGAKYDLWEINTEDSYHEENNPKDEDLDASMLESSQPLIPERLRP